MPSSLLTSPPGDDFYSFPEDFGVVGNGNADNLYVSLDALLESPESLAAALAVVQLPVDGLLLLVPPPGRGPGRDGMLEIASRNLVRAVSTVLDIGLVLPRHVLLGRTGSLLSDVCDGRYPRSVIELPASLLYRGVSPKFTLGVLHLTREPARSAFITLTSTGAADLGDQLTRLWSGWRKTASGFSLDSDEFDISTGLLPTQLDTSRRQRIAEASEIGGLYRIGELCEVFGGMRANVGPRDSQPPDGVPVLHAKRIRSIGILKDEDPDLASPSDGPTLAKGDIALRVIGDPRLPIVAAEVLDSDLPLVAGRHVIVLRPSHSRTDSDRMVLRYFVESQRFASQLRSRHIGSVHLSVDEVSNAMAPMPDISYSRALEDVKWAADAFDAWRQESISELKLSFDADNLEASRKELIRRSSQLRQRAKAADMLGELDHRVATRYPLPIAYRWRRALAARRSADELVAVLQAQEVLLAYLATMALTLARDSGIKVGCLIGMSSRLSEGKSGLGLNQWKEILNESAKSSAFGTIPDNQPLAEIRGYFQDTNVQEAARRLEDTRNFLAHLGEYGPEKEDRICRDSWRDLEMLLTAAEFVTDYPLVRITETLWNEFSGSHVIRFRRLVGDSPVVPISSMSVIPRIETNSLYLLDANEGLHLLRPLMIGTDCKECGHWSTFLVNRYRRIDGVVEYKSLEHGHTLDGAGSSSDDLIRVGLLEGAVTDGPPSVSQPDHKLLQLIAEGIQASGHETRDGFVVRKGSQARADPQPSGPVQALQLRGELLQRGILKKDGTTWRLTEDHTFDSASTAAIVMLGPMALNRGGWQDSAEEDAERALPLEPGSAEAG